MVSYRFILVCDDWFHLGLVRHTKRASMSLTSNNVSSRQKVSYMVIGKTKCALRSKKIKSNISEKNRGNLITIHTALVAAT